MFVCLNVFMTHVLINKPKDWTSHDVVAYIRNLARKQSANKKIKVGHSGTLDPFATGLLIIGIGRESTKQLDKFKNMPKTYIATLKLGAVSDTYDSTGHITSVDSAGSIAPPSRGSWRSLRGLLRGRKREISKEEIKRVLKTFIGKQKQLPPMYSAKKIKGKKLYELARKGIEIERQPHNIEIYNIKLMEYNHPILKIKVECSTGTYIRTLAHDIGQALQTGAYCDELERTKIGDCSLDDAKAPKQIDKNDLNI